MIIAFVHIPLLCPKRDIEEVTRQSVEATPFFKDIPGLRRKYFLNSDTGGGGIYEFETLDAAQAFFDENWSDWMLSRFGVRPSLTIFENPVILDNEQGEVRINGTPIPATL